MFDPALIPSPLRFRFLPILLLLIWFPAWTGVHEKVIRVEIEPGIPISVYQIEQDSMGFLWILSSQGLLRYDGTEFQPIKKRPGDPNSLNHDDVTHIYKDKKNQLWVCTQLGVNRLMDQTSFQRYDAESKGMDTETGKQMPFLNEPVYAMAQRTSEEEDSYWLAVPGGIASFSAGDGKVSRLPILWEGEPVNPHNFAMDSRNALWMSTDHGLWLLEKGVSKPVRILPDTITWLKSVQDLGNRILWLDLGDRRALYYSNENRLEYWERRGPAQPPWEMITTLHRTRNGQAWLGTNDRGLWFSMDGVTESNWNHFGSDLDGSDNIPFGRVNALFEDNSGLIWVGTDQGLAHIRRTSDEFHHIGSDPEDPRTINNKMVTSILADSQGNLWVGTREGLNLRRKDSPVFIQPGPIGSEELGQIPIISIVESPKGLIWIATPKSIYFYNPHIKMMFKAVPDIFKQFQLKTIVTMICDRNGTLWLGGGEYGGGLVRWSPREKIFQMHHNPQDPQSLPSDKIQYLFEDQKGRIWVNHLPGLSLLDPESGSFTAIVPLDDLPEPDIIYAMDQDENGWIWMATSKGLYAWMSDKKRLTLVSEEMGLPSNRVFAVQHDQEGYLWLTHDKGLTRFQPKMDEAVNFTLADGLQNIFRPGPSTRDSEGNILFGGRNGITSFAPSQIRGSEYIPPVWITSIRVDGRQVDLDSGNRDLDLDHDTKELAFSFAVMDFTNPEKNLYSYRLAGSDKGWSIPNNKGSAYFMDLPPGEYRLQVKGSNSNGHWFTSPQEIGFTMNPPLWMRGEMLMLYLFLGPGLVFLGYRGRIRHLHRRHEELERVVEDRTCALRTEKEKTEAQARKLMEMDRLKSQFFSNISHEFRTPLTLIIGPLEAMLQKSTHSESEKQSHQLQVMLRNGRRLLRLINQLLDISKLEAGKMKLLARPLPIMRFLSPLAQAFQSLAGSRDIQLEVSGEELEVYLDPEKMEKVIFNLVGNAFQFTTRGRIAIHVSKDQDPAGLETVCIKVSDTGVGIPASSLALIFDRFHQVDGSYTRECEGTGIGLSLVKELVELHRGHIRVESTLNEGTTFYINLPLGCSHLEPHEIVAATPEEDLFTAEHAAVELAHLERGSAGAFAICGLGETILVVDDHPDIREYVCNALAGNYRMLEAEDGCHGLEMMRRHKPDLVISDVMMPNMDGYDMCRTMRRDKDLSHIPVIMLTAKASDEMKVEGLEIGANDYLSKPFNVRELAARVRNLLEIRQQERLMKKSLDMAHKVQVNMLPGAIPKVKGLDIASFSEPAREVGGDYYDFLTFDDHRLGVVIGDVSGKGMPAALYMTMTKGLVQALSSGDASPKQTLDLINRQFHKASAANIFLSLQYAIIDTRALTITLSNAGHLPVILHRHETGETSYLKTGGMAIGLEQGTIFNRVTAEEQWNLRPGDTLIFYTDGITEGMNATNEVFGEKRLLDLVTANNCDNAAELLARLRSECSEFVGNMDQSDDMTAIVIRIPYPAASPPLAASA